MGAVTRYWSCLVMQLGAVIILCLLRTESHGLPKRSQQRSRFVQATSHMDPQRAGNRNMPAASASVTDLDAGEKDADDAYLPYINIHYDYEGQDWISRQQNVNQTNRLEKDFYNIEQEFYKNHRRLSKLLAQRNNIFRQLEVRTLQNAIATKARLNGFVAPETLPLMLATGTVASDPVRVESMRNAVFEEWKKSVSKDPKKKITENDVEKEFTLLTDPNYSSEDVYTHLANQYTIT